MELLNLTSNCEALTYDAFIKKKKTTSHFYDIIDNLLLSFKVILSHQINLLRFVKANLILNCHSSLLNLKTNELKNYCCKFNKRQCTLTGEPRSGADLLMKGNFEQSDHHEILAVNAALQPYY